MLEWIRGRELSRFGNLRFVYNAGGIRQEKRDINGNVIASYFTEGKRIHSETRGNQTLFYFYDATGITGMERRIGNSVSRFYFQKNIQGDVERIFDASGNLVCRYYYDAWGNHSVIDPRPPVTGNVLCGELTITGKQGVSVDPEFIGNVNPFRYRGYYFDCETGLYYLNSRYYDPRTGRFINADDPRVLPVETMMPNGANLFMYAYNNPVMFTDSTGYGFLLGMVVSAMIAGALIRGTTNAISAIAAGQDGWGVFGAFLGGALTGAVMGGAFVLGAAVAVGAAPIGGFALLGLVAVAGFGAGLASYSIQAGLRSDMTWNRRDFWRAGGSGAAQAAFAFFTGWTAGKLGAITASHFNPIHMSVFGALKPAGLIGASVLTSKITYQLIGYIGRTLIDWIIVGR